MKPHCVVVLLLVACTIAAAAVSATTTDAISQTSEYLDGTAASRICECQLALKSMNSANCNYTLRMSPTLQRWRCRYAYRLRVNAAENSLCERLNIQSLYSPRHVYPSCLRHAPAKSLFLDIGANTGQDTEVACKSGLNVIAFEPVHENIEELIKTVRPFQKQVNITIVQTALSSIEGNVTFYVPHMYKGMKNPFPTGGAMNSQEWWTKRRREIQKKIVVPMTTLDKYMEKKFRGIFRDVFAIHMDVQGHELPVLCGAMNSISSAPPPYIHLEFWPAGMRHMGYEPNEIGSFLSALGYVCLALRPNREKVYRINKYTFAAMGDRLGYTELMSYIDVSCHHYNNHLIKNNNTQGSNSDAKIRSRRFENKFKIET
jgi:FkbM family methyltransferase